MKFLINSITDVIVEVIDVTYCRNFSGNLVTTLFCSRIPNYDDIDDEEFKKRQAKLIRESHTYLNKVLYSECVIEVRGDSYYAIKNRWGYNDAIVSMCGS
ncbi:MAG: hypothetical protein M0R17_03880 [Candidatus Omnitrophica bacterium]|jgi:hypothetical protein|nr:hypothetical protein [Candidatus Omnitrophota bacterium]